MSSLHRAAALAAALGMLVPAAAAGATAGAADPAGRSSLSGPKLDQDLKTPGGVTVSGALATRDGRRLISGSIGMHPLRRDAPMSVAVEDAEIRQDGTFTFRNVPPGRYLLRARALVQGVRMPHFSTFQIIVDELDLPRLDLVLLPGASIEGQLIVEPGRAAFPSFTTARVHAVSTEGDALVDQGAADVKKDGSYRMHGVVAGAQWVVVEGLPEGWLVKSVMHQGRDVTDTGLEAASGQEFTDVRVTITDVATEVSGVVRDAAGRPATGATVLAVPLGEHFWTRTSRRFGRARSDRDGRYRIRGLPAGEYRLAALIDSPESEIYNRERLRGLVATGVPLRLEPLETRALDLALTTRPAPR